MKILLDKEFQELKENIEMYKNKYNEALEDYYNAERGHKTIYSNYLDELNKNGFLQQRIDKTIEYIKENLIQNDITNQDYQNKYKEVLKILKGE